MTNLPEIMIAQQFLEVGSGWFSVQDVSADKSTQFIYLEKFEKLVDMGHAERHPTMRGRYRRRESDLTNIGCRYIDLQKENICV